MFLFPFSLRSDILDFVSFSILPFFSSATFFYEDHQRFPPFVRPLTLFAGLSLAQKGLFNGFFCPSPESVIRLPRECRGNDLFIVGKISTSARPGSSSLALAW